MRLPSETPGDPVEAITQVLLAMFPNGAGLHEPRFGGNEWKYVKECLDTGWVSSAGKFVDRFENDLARYTGAQYAVATSNGTSALHSILLLSEARPQDEVLVPALTFVATANAVAYCHAIPHFVDSEFETLGIDPSKLEIYLEEIGQRSSDGLVNKKTGRRISCLVVVHAFGHPARMDELLGVAEKFQLRIIEDAAESLGSFFKGQHTGTFADLSAFSFNGNKIITTGGGGAILTNNQALAQRAKHLTTTAKTPHPWAFNHDQVGFNYRLPNINAALGCAQLEELDGFLKQKRRLASIYQERLSQIPYGQFQKEPANCRSNHWLNAFLLNPEVAHIRDRLLDRLNKEKIQSRPAWTLLHKLPMYAQCPRMNLDCAENLEARLIHLPSSSHLVSQVTSHVL